jgi:hypothetical protein
MRKREKPVANLRQRLENLIENPRLCVSKDSEFAKSLLSSYERTGRLTSGRRVWVDRLEQRYAADAPDNSDKALTARIEALMPRTPASSWDRGFLESLQEQNRQGREFSPRQAEIMDKIEVRFSPEAISRSADWTAGYTIEMRDRARIVAGYYKANPPYYGDLATSILNDDDFIPTEKQYNSLTSNKYAAKVLTAHYAEPKFPQGAKVEVRKTGGYAVASKKGFVLQTDASPVTNAAKGTKKYLILPVGEPTPIVIEERHLKLGRF